MKLEEIKKNLNKPLRQVSLCFLVKENQVLLAMKKRGFGKERWNGTGGKPDSGETIEQSAIRETQEEIAVTPLSLKKMAVLDFYFPHNHDNNQQVVVFLVEKWQGQPKESEEMKPQWFDIKKLPFDTMWSDDPIWLPRVLNRILVKAEFLFDQNDQILDFKIKEGVC
jgi:mutator protein MutT